MPARRPERFETNLLARSLNTKLFVCAVLSPSRNKKTPLTGKLKKEETLLLSKQWRQGKSEHAENHHRHDDDHNNAETFSAAGEVHGISYFPPL